MKSIGRRLLLLVWAFALAANGGVGLTAQDKQRKQDKKNDENVGNVLTGATLVDMITISAPDPIGDASISRQGGASAFQF